MTDELKTLKDLKTRIESKQLGFILLEKELKQEAIKWVKCEKPYLEAEAWIKMFFNITEEELK